MPIRSIARKSCLPAWLLLLAVAAHAETQLPGVLDLAGPWRLAVAGSALEEAPEVELPATWRDLDLASHEGVVRLARVVALPADWRRTLAPSGLAVWIDEAKYGAYDLYSGPVRLGGHGSGRQRLPAPASRIFELPSERVEIDGRVRLELRFRRVGWASELAACSGPVGERIALGDRETLRAMVELGVQRARREALPSALISALLAAVGLYHLQLFSRRRERVEYLWFGLTALDFAAVVFAVRFGDRLTQSFAAGRRLESFGIHLSAVLLIQLLWPYLERPIRPWLRRYQLAHGVIAAAVVVLPIEWVVRSGPARWLFMLPLLIGLAALFARRSWRGDPDARTLGLGGLAVVGAGAAELTLQAAGAGTSHPLSAGALALFALAMAVSLSDRYSRLHLELDQMRHQLEQKVEEATAELSTANRLLGAENAERQVAEESMRMLERAVEQSIDGIVVSDLAGSTEFLNESWARMHGYEVPEVLGYDLNLFHTREQMQREVYPLLRQVRERGSFDGEVGHRRRDGETFPTWMTVSLLRDPQGQAEGIVAIARDLTRRRQSEQEQRRLEVRLQQTAKLESLGDLAAGIAHDYNNLLTGMISHANLVLEEIPAESPAGEKIRQIERTAERAAELSDQLLAFAGEEAPELETLELGAMLQSLELRLRERIPEQTRLQFQLKRGLPPVDADPAQLKRVVLRLVANAADAIGAGPGVITLRTSQVKAERDYFLGAQPSQELAAGSYVFFEVSDSGVGIDAETRDRIFDPFFTTKASGRGLGLATVLGIVGAHGGAIKVYSEPGRGTTFEILFPASVHRQVATRPRAADGWQAAGTILVVDDEALVLEVAREILESRGFDVVTAAGGRQAIEIYRRRGEEIAAVVLDMTMPEMSGEQVFRELRRLDSNAQVVIMSGYSRQKVSQRVVELGLGAFLHKPFRPQDLIDKLRELLDSPALEGAR